MGADAHHRGGVKNQELRGHAREIAAAGMSRRRRRATPAAPIAAASNPSMSDALAISAVSHAARAVSRRGLTWAAPAGHCRARRQELP